LADEMEQSDYQEGIYFTVPEVGKVYLVVAQNCTPCPVFADTVRKNYDDHVAHVAYTYWEAKIKMAEYDADWLLVQEIDEDTWH